MPNRVKRLFYVNGEVDCAGCDRYLFNSTEDEWQETTSDMSVGDHAVVDGTEMVFLGDGNYRELWGNEKELWDDSLPEEVMIERIPHRTYKFPESVRDDPLISSRGAFATFG